MPCPTIATADVLVLRSNRRASIRNGIDASLAANDFPRMMLTEKTSKTVTPIVDDANSSLAGPAVALPLLVPQEPLIKIRAHRPWAAVDLRELWLHRELLYFLIWRELKARYKQTVLGVSWVILQPLLSTIVFTIVLGKLVGVQTGKTPYPLFLYAGLLPWIFFSNAVSSGSQSLVASSQMITKVYLPRIIIPAAAVGVRLSDFLVASVVLVVLMRYYGIPLDWPLLFAPLLVIHLSLLALALSAWLSALNVKYRDTGTALPVLLQLWMFASPIVYSATLVPPRWRWLYQLNPLTGIVEGFRSSLLGLPLNRSDLIVSIAITIVLLVGSTFVFGRMEDEFADIV
jgi:lipopolysaccharide transport system permease protein